MVANAMIPSSALRSTLQLGLLSLSLFSGLVRGQSCGAEDFSVMYNGQAYFTVSSRNGTTTIAGPLQVGGLASFPGGATFGSSLMVTGPTMFATVFAAGGITSTNGIALTQGGYLRVESGVAQFLSGAMFDVVRPTFPAGIGGPVTMAGPLTASSGLSVTGGLQVSSGVAQFSSGATFSSVAPTFPAGIAGAVTLSGAVTAAAGLTVSAGGATVNGGLSVPSGGVSVTGTTTTSTMNANVCSCLAYSSTAVPNPTIYYSTQPAVRYQPGPLTNNWYYTGEYLTLNLASPTRMRFHARQMVYNPNTNIGFIISIGSTTSGGFSQVYGTPQAHDMSIAGLWGTVTMTWSLTVPAGAQTYAIWFYPYSGSLSGYQIANEDRGLHRLFCDLHAVAE